MRSLMSMMMTMKMQKKKKKNRPLKNYFHQIKAWKVILKFSGMKSTMEN